MSFSFDKIRRGLKIKPVKISPENCVLFFDMVY